MFPSETNEPPEAHTFWGFFLFLEWEGLTPQAGYRLLIAVQPFDDVVAGYTSRNGDDKR